MRSRLIALVLVLAFVAVACGDDDDGAPDQADRPRDIPSVLAEVKGLDRDAREARLRELAKAEGNKVTFYTSMRDDTAAAIAKAFEKASGLGVSLYRASTTDLLQRLSVESDAGKVRADVIEAAGRELAALDPAQLAAYTSPVVDDLIDSARHGRWTADQMDVFVVAWNTDAVSDAERPRSWEDLADPRWKGKLVMNVDDVEWFATLRKYWIDSGKSEAEADRLFSAMGANARVVRSHSLMAQLLATGEFDVAASPFFDRIRQMHADGAPVSYQPPVEPSIATASGVAVPRRVPHPAAAVLLADWLLSDGQDAMVERGTLVTRKDLQVNELKLVHADLEAIARESAKWDARYAAIIGDAEVVEEKG